MLIAVTAALLLGATAPDSVRPDVEVRGTVLRHAPDVRRCYEAEGLRRNALLAGTVEVELVILPTGIVDDVRLADVAISGVGTRETLVCIAAVARNWRFERGAYAVESVTFPFQLTPDAPSRVAVFDPRI